MPRVALGIVICSAATAVGVARTKVLAKMASRAAKPDGLLVVQPERETEKHKGWSGGGEFDLGHPFGHPLKEGAERSLVDPGGALDRGTKNVEVQKNSTAGYVESNRQRDDDYEYYRIDATYHITGPRGHRLTMAFEGGLLGMLPATVVRRLLDDNPGLGLERRHDVGPLTRSSHFDRLVDPTLNGSIVPNLPKGSNGAYLAN